VKGLVEPYSKLALVYDTVMEHVDYGEWADHIGQLAEKFHPEAKKILELGCGTGELSARLAENFDWRVCSTDIASEMVAKAQEKYGQLRNIQFNIADFRSLENLGLFDIIILIHDGLNYCLENEEIVDLFNSASSAMNDDSIFIFDQSTPQNSLNNIEFFEDEGEENGVYYERTSKYNPKTKYHENHFIIYQEAESFEELHVQKAYLQSEIMSLLDQCDFEVLAAFSGFTMEEANEKSERIHWVVKKDSGKAR